VEKHINRSWEKELEGVEIYRQRQEKMEGTCRQPIIIIIIIIIIVVVIVVVVVVMCLKENGINFCCYSDATQTLTSTKN
jgi:flagellar basal body-associated protein FliL